MPLITRILFSTLCVLAAIRPTLGLKSAEVGYFESEEIEVVANLPGVYGSILVGTNGDGTHTLRSNGIPDHAVGAFPNENNMYAILQQTFEMRFPQDPTMNEEPTCLPASSIIGFATNGVAIFSPFDANSTDLNIDFDDDCQGRTGMGGIYYYAQVPDECSTFIPGFRGHDPSRIYGVALDGFPIYGPGEEATKITNADLDACHGKSVNGEYRYYMTDEWPYVLGCFRGTPDTVTGAPAASDVCKFACNKADQSNNVTCVDDFPDTTKLPDMITTAEPIVGVTADELIKFTSRMTLEQNTMKTGFVNIIITNLETLTFSSNGIPDHDTANFSDGNYSYMLQEQNFTLTIPRYPEFLKTPACLPSAGIIGFATNGVALFSPYDSKGNDVNINGTFDSCSGSTSPSGIYHYTKLSDCVYTTSEQSQIYGIALDGFPIYGPGDNVTNEELDVCHGRLIDGQYRYYVTKEFPYILGCFKGAPQELKRTPKVHTSSDCRFACNVNGTTQKSDTSFCEKPATGQNLLLYIVIPIAAFIVVLLALCVVCCLRNTSQDCCTFEEKDEESEYHL